MIEGIELQVITRLLVSQDDNEIDTLLSYNPDDYFSSYIEEIKFIHEFKRQHNFIPSVFEFRTRFENTTTLQNVNEPLHYLQTKLEEHRQSLMLIETFNHLKELGDGDVRTAWKYLEMQCEKSQACDTTEAMNIIADAEKRAKQVQEYSKQQRIPTGFVEIDRVMYGGLSTVEELLVLVARTNNGKSWICAKMMESAQANGFPVAYYSPEMQAPYLATRFDTWRNHFENNRLFKGDYSSEYLDYINNLKSSPTPAYILEDKDFASGVSVSLLASFVRKHHIKLLIVDGISYLQDDKKSSRDQEKYKNIALDLFQLSKRYGCAVVLVMQANREVRSKDSDKGESIPDLFNTEGSDQPGRIATQAFGIRQVFDEHKLDIKLLKSRMAMNQQNVFSYSWSINDGKLEYVSSDSDNMSSTPSTTPGSFKPISFGGIQPDSSDLSLIDNEYDPNSLNDSDEDIEF